jgi:hypothetical protein
MQLTNYKFISFSKISTKKSKNNTYGWVRAEILGKFSLF